MWIEQLFDIIGLLFYRKSYNIEARLMEVYQFKRIDPNYYLFYDVTTN